jgi:hypothetical protein
VVGGLELERDGDKEEGPQTVPYAFVSWDRDELQFFKLTDDQQLGPKHVATAPQWHNGELRMHLDGATLRLDPARLTATMESDAAAERLLKHAQKHGVRVLLPLADDSILQIKDGREIQLWRRDDTTIRLVSADDAAETQNTFLMPAISPTPDGKRVLIHAWDTDEQFQVFDAEGKKLIDKKHQGNVLRYLR